MTPQQMWAADSASRTLGMALEEASPGHARVSLVVQDSMLNGHGLCHGGIIFTLADTAFAFACNTAGQDAVGQSCTITYLRPARAGETLVATAQELALAGRSGLYDVHITGPDGAVAEFRGLSRVVRT